MKRFLTYGSGQGSLQHEEAQKMKAVICEDSDFTIKTDSSFNSSTVFLLNVTSAALISFHCTNRLIVKIALQDRK